MAEEKRMNLHQKLAAIMADVRYLSKDDQVAFKETRYKAISEEKVTGVIHDELVKYGVTIFPADIEEFKREGTLTSVKIKYQITNVEDPKDYIYAYSVGTGADTQDKGSGKAQTYAFKYLLLRLFAIPTGEDPDKVSSAELDEKERKQKERDAALLEGKKKVLLDLCGKCNINIDQFCGQYKTTWDAVTEDVVASMLSRLKKYEAQNSNAQ